MCQMDMLIPNFDFLTPESSQDKALMDKVIDVKEHTPFQLHQLNVV